MVKLTNKVERHQLASDLQQSGSLDVDRMKRWLMMLYEDAKERLVAATGDAVPRTQGEANAYKNMYIQLTRPAPGKTGVVE